MVEVLGQRSLLGFVALFAWLLLFHLLVNIWLLCVFTSLLVVLGGWLGSQAVLESNSLVHLERFISLKPIPSSVEDEEQLDQEIHNTVRKIIRDFVSSWYSTISTERAFEMDVQEAMVSMAMELKKRARCVDRKALSKRVLNLYGCHLQNFLKAKELIAEQDSCLPPAEQPSDARDRLWKVYSELGTPHHAVKSAAMELNYTRAVVDLLLYSLVPLPHLESRTGRLVVGELITCNVLLPFFSKLSDPDWLNVLLVQVFTSQSLLAADPVESSSTQPPPPQPPPAIPSAPPSPPAQSDVPPQEQETTTPRLLEQTRLASPSSPVTSEVDTEIASDTDTNIDKLDLVGYDTIDSELYCPQINMEEEEPSRPFLRHYIRPGKSNPFYQENDSDLDSPLAEYKRDSLDSLVMDGHEGSQSDLPTECATLTDGLDLDLDVYPGLVDEMCPKVLLNSQQLDQPDGCGPSCFRPAEGTRGFNNSLHELDKEGSPVSANPARELLLGLEQMGTGTPNELTTASPLLVSSSPHASFSFEPLSSPEGPVLIQNLRITGTITAKEHRGTGSHPYTLYTIKYETVVGCENAGSLQPGCEEAEATQVGRESPAAGQPVAYHMVNRRYSEFLNLQTRLEEKHELRKLIKGVKGPKKIFPDMPFGNMDSDKIEARKGLLETFLKQLCAIPEAANSEEMQEFLALNTDARIAFVKKPFIVSRIDKIVVNAIVDTLKTAFPRSEPPSPTEDNEGEMESGRMTSDKKNRSRLRFSSKNSPYVNGSDMRPQMLFCWEQSNTLFNGMSLADLEAFVTGQERLIAGAAVCTLELEREADGLREWEPCVHMDGSPRLKRRVQPVSEMMLAEPALSILCLLMTGQWSWLCTENIQRTIRMLFGTLIDR
ncbi:Sorting nexin-19 [Merluccius polli]|uniref:Sorting nexin-19 n=1 Tax=Merluccius polli TaxID=89951 RepID=A0AA47MT83_MERPO|nr:Sorting nexin-19 [Merluccius polli]